MKNAENARGDHPYSRRRALLRALLLCAAGLAINLLGVKAALGLKLPLFLDSIGTMLAAALGGVIPGIAVGFLTNLINGFADYTTAYYGSLNALIAILAAWFARRGWFGKIPKILLATAAFALVGGGIGSVLTWFLYGGGFGEGISAPLAHAIHGGVPSVFLSQLAADLLIDLADKAVSVALVALTLRLVPENVRRLLHLNGWRQAPLSDEALHTVRQGTFARKLSLRGKLVLLISAATLVIAVAVTAISFVQFRESNLETQIKVGGSIARLAASHVDPSRVDDYLENGAAAEGYGAAMTNLTHLLRSSPDIRRICVCRILPDGCHVVLNPETPDAPGEPAGAVLPFDDTLRPWLPALLEGQPIRPIVSGKAHGRILTLFEPVYDENGVCRCYAAVDISMDELAAGERVYLTRVVALFAGFFLLILAASVWLAEYNVIMPINTMSLAAGTFAFDTESVRADSLKHIHALKIRTGDEIENLYHALVRTTEDTVRYIADAQQKNDTISKLQNGMIMVLADLVESRDQCTGDHIRKTAAYAEIILRQMQRDGAYPEQLTDDFIFDVVHSAPLHDVGKIHVPDALLNKPGRLTDEEYQEMRRHTTMGSNIIAHAMGSVDPGASGYLNEAQNLAAFHHEKWDGSGYPRGLSGEQIPLSARVMAVADVFDALISRRSYKPGFPIDKAMDIIREGIGSHFDPKVGEAFLRAEKEVREVAEKTPDE